MSLTPLQDASKESALTARTLEIEVLEAMRDALGRIKENGYSSDADGRTLRDMAEAYAWLHRPDQPHGGSVATTVKR